MDNTNKVYQGGELMPAILPKTTPPTNVADVKQTAPFVIPTSKIQTGNTTSVSGLISYNNSLIKSIEEQQKQAQETQTTQTAPWFQRLLSSSSPEETRKSAQETTGLNVAEYFGAQKAALDELKTLNESYNNEVAKRDEEIRILQENAEGRLDSGISQEVSRIENRYAVRLNQISSNINTKAAIYEAEQGRFNEAQQYINQAVQDATAETRYNMEMFQTFYQINQDVIDSLDSKYQDAFKNAMMLSERAYEQDYKNKLRQISAAAGMPGNSGYNLFTTSQLNTGANKAGLDLETFSGLDYEVKNFFVNTSPTTVSGYMDIINSANDGTGEDPEAVKEEITASNLAQPVKDYFISLLATATTSDGDTTSWWDRVRDFFNSGNSFSN